MTSHLLSLPGGEIAYTITGEGPLMAAVPGMADTQASYRFLAPQLAAAGYRVVVADLRGHGDSSTGWDSYTRTDTAEDLAALIRELGGPAVVIGQSFSGGAASILAAEHPELVSAVVEIAPFTRVPGFSMRAFMRNDHQYRTGAMRLGRFALTGKAEHWVSYLETAYPTKPSDWNAWVQQVRQHLAEPARVKAARAMLQAAPKDAGAALRSVKAPALIVMGSADSDFPDPAAEGAGILSELGSEVKELALIDGAGHYPHAERPDEVAQAILSFLGRTSVGSGGASEPPAA